MENYEFELAEQFVNLTNTPIFLTGKAGTGKTTFLREVIKRSEKKSVIVAPTGVAAINAGGVTIHSMFGLPTKSYVPSNDNVDPNVANNQQMLSNHFHYTKEKLEVLLEMELLVIDEVSMVRADIMDAVDFALRYVRRIDKPFGGVQVLCIGDMYQLPPVIKDEEWPLLSRYYDSPYFFDSKSFKKLDPIYIELRKIYRQSDNYFIRILNNIRNQDFQEEDFEALKIHYNPEFETSEPGYITLTTHNKKADAINEKELQKLDGEALFFDAEVNGDFGDNMFPTERLLRLKIGAQVMFVKNDTSGERKYFNGKIGIIEEYDKESGLRILFPDEGNKIFVKQETWENIRYSLNSEDDKLEQNKIGSFKQFPLRLAWAITIHKSQGLTFEKAVIDAGESFAPGQVYVALSRCTSMDNMVLKSLITGRNIFSDPRIVDFSGRIMKDVVLENRLVTGKRKYELDSIMEKFDFQKLEKFIFNWDKNVSKLKSVDRKITAALTAESIHAIKALQPVAQKFVRQLNLILDKDMPEMERAEWLQERLEKAIGYFGKEMFEKIVQPWEKHYEVYRVMAKLRKYQRETLAMVYFLQAKLEQLYELTLDGKMIYPEELRMKQEKPKKEESKKEKSKGETYDITLELFRSGKTLPEIADSRGMALSTIEGHISKWVSAGKIALNELMDENKINAVMDALEELGTSSLGPIKGKLGDDFSFSEIRWVIQSPLKQKAVSQ
ncbi:MAG: helix-turn-helix domain-containing protein [Bacteroidetes bacterium]|nr:helix-turn-helix domain-containing protein [Bacteroidota bacterium]